MIEILPASDNVLSIHASGTLTGDDYDRVIAEIEAKLKAHDKIGILFDATGFDDMTADAFRKDISYSFSKLGEWNRFARNALITDKQWMKALARGVALFIPSIEIKTFDPSERDAAVTWVSDVQGR